MAKIPVNITLDEGVLNINGMPVSLVVLDDLLRAVVSPDPRRWIRFERIGDAGMVHIRMEEQGAPMKCLTCNYTTTAKGFMHCPMDGTILNTAPELEVSNGSSSPSVGSYGKKAQDPRDTPAPN
jgi:hypothetical protein